MTLRKQSNGSLPVWKKKSRVLSPQERRRVAYHEMGHALVASSLPGRRSDPEGLNHPARRRCIRLHNATTNGRSVPTGRERSQKPHHCAHGWTRSQSLIFVGDVSTGAADDLQRATEIALEMVTRHGMDDNIGQRTYARPPQSFLPGLPTDHVEAAETTAREIDVAVRDIIAGAFERATDILRSRRSDLEEGVKLLLTRETLTVEEFPTIRRAA